MPNPDTLPARSLPRSSARDLERLASEVDTLTRTVADLVATVADLQAKLLRLAPDLDELLFAIVRVVGNHVFSTKQIDAHSRLEAGMPLLIELERAGATTPQRLGKALRRIEGINIDGRTVQRISNDQDGIIWQVVDCLTPNTF